MVKIAKVHDLGRLLRRLSQGFKRSQQRPRAEQLVARSHRGGRICHLHSQSPAELKHGVICALQERLRVHHLTVKADAGGVQLEALPRLLVGVYWCGYGWGGCWLVLHKSKDGWVGIELFL
jgi:hypothetical protein